MKRIRRCPKDVSAAEFHYLLDHVPRGFVLVRTQRDRLWRVFTFLISKPVPGFRKGQMFTTAAVCKDGV